MRKTPVFFLILMLGASGILLAAADYGESSASLGQFTDEFDSLDYTSVLNDVRRNSTYNAIELNDSIISTMIFNLTSLREHDYFGGVATPVFSFTINNNDEIRIISTGGSQGRGYIFLTVNRGWLNDKYVRWRYYPYCDTVNAAYQTQYFEVYDGTYDRSSNTDFPSTVGGDPWNPIPTKGNGNLYSYQNVDGLNNWFTKDFQIDTSGGTEDNATLFWWLDDWWNTRIMGYYVDWIEVNTGAGGTGNLITINYNNSSPITIEVAGGQGDYGFSLNSELPFDIGGFETKGYFTTTDYLDEANGSILVQLTNATIPGGTGITVEFSDDNSIWINQTSLSDGFQAIDLRTLNWSSSYYLRYNMSGTPELTPRIYQSRLITTIGEGGAGDVTVTVIESDFPWIAIAIILMCVAYLLVSSK